MLTFAQQIIKHGTAQIDEVLAATQLKSHGFDKWYRLSNVADIADGDDFGVIVMFLKSDESDIVKFILRLLNQASKLRVYLCYVPRRRCGEVSKVLLSVRHGLNNVPWQEEASGPNSCVSIAGKLWLTVLDIPIYLYMIDPTTLSLCAPRTYRKVHLEGDVLPIENLLESVKQVLSYISLSGMVSIIGVGADGKSIAKNISNYVNDTTTAVEQTLAAEELPTPDSAVQQLHEYANQIINTQLLALNKPSPSQPTSLPVCAKNGLSDIMSDSILNRCIIQLCNNVDEDVRFVKDEIGESGVTKRAQQASFVIRLPQPRTWEPPKVETSRDVTIKSIIVMDRAVDWISPFLTPFTYEAMIDLEWGIEGVNHVSIPAEDPGGAVENLKLSDALFYSVRDMLLSDIGPVLHTEALKIQSQQNPSNSANPPPGSVDEMHSALMKIKEYERAQRELGCHVSLVSRLIKDLWKNPGFYSILKIEDDILNNSSTPTEVYSEILSQLALRSVPVTDVLRLMMLLLLIRGSNQTRVGDIRSLVKLVQNVLTSLCHLHGVGVFQRWYELEAMVFKTGVSPVITHNHNSASPLSYVHSGFTPLSVEVLESIIKQEAHVLCNSANMFRQKFRLSENGKKDGGILLVFPHHITYSELAALRTLAKTVNRQFIIITSAINGYQTFFGERHHAYDAMLRNAIL